MRKAGLVFCILCLGLFLNIGCLTTGGTSTDDVCITSYTRHGQWLRGDLHAHSLHSDGDSPAALVLDTAYKNGLDFFVITDHDTSMRGETPHWEDSDYNHEDMIILYGVEWTSSKGHANVWNKTPFDYSIFWEANRNKDPFLAALAAKCAGSVFSVNHPLCPGNEWEYSYEMCRVMEVWNGPFLFPNGNGRVIREVWDSLLLSGKRITGVGGSDSHQIQGFLRHVNPPGFPTTWVYAESDTPEAVLEAIEQGWVTVSYAPYGPRLELSADTDGDGIYDIGMGQNIASGSRCFLRVSVVFSENDEWSDKSFTIILYENGKRIAKRTVNKNKGTGMIHEVFPKGRTYYRAELRGLPDGNPYFRLLCGDTVAITNPIYFGYDDKTTAGFE